jgi:hypothetical protein
LQRALLALLFPTTSLFLSHIFLFLFLCGKVACTTSPIISQILIHNKEHTLLHCPRDTQSINQFLIHVKSRRIPRVPFHGVLEGYLPATACLLPSLSIKIRRRMQGDKCISRRKRGLHLSSCIVGAAVGTTNVPIVPDKYPRPQPATHTDLNGCPEQVPDANDGTTDDFPFPTSPTTHLFILFYLSDSNDSLHRIALHPRTHRS